MIGQTISHYEIVEKLGEGGMGVVYKAQDTRLDRPVALKFLAPHLLRDEEGRKRFKREAKAAAALDHPNICTVHEIDEVDGRTFIAMAFLEGESLNKKIEQGPLKIPEALSIAIQVAEGLEAAHEKGITHRDIKPDNIMLMAGSRGLVKIMDFGLAQLAGSSKFTREGTTLGTMLYMSPEQAGGAETERRTDIWSLGVVLYEMIAGQPPFRGEFDQALVYSLMNEPPEPLTAVRTGVPKELERIVNKCLAKKPEQRYQHADELLVDLQELRRELEPHTARVAAKPVATKRTSPWFFGAAAVALLGAEGLTWLVKDSYGPEPNAPPQYTLTQITRDSGYTGQPALSPDGKLLAYVSDRGGVGSLDLWVQQIAGGDPIQLTRTQSDVWGPSFSPDGSEIVYGGFVGEGGVYVVPALGGSARRLVAERGWNPKFSPKGESVAYSVGYENTTGAIYIVSSRGGRPRRLELDIPWAAQPIWSPEGNYLLFLGSLDPVPGGRGVDWWIAPSGGGRAVDLNVRDAMRKIGIQRQNSHVLVRLNQARPLQWLADGNWVLFSASLGDSTNLWRLGISAREGRITTQPQRLTYGTNEAEPSASLDGRIAFTSIRSNFDVWSLPIDPNQAKPRGPLEKLIGGAPQDDYPSVSDDGQKLVFVSDRSGNWDVWMKDLGSGAETPITITPDDERRAVISPDGAHVAYIRREGTQTNLYAVPVAGGTEKGLSDNIGSLTGWTPDSQSVVYHLPGQRTQFRTVDLGTGERVDIVQHPDYDVHSAAFSPDGRWLSLKLLIDPGRVESTYIAPVRDGKAVEPSHWIRITEGQYDSRNGWSPDGNILYFWSRRDGSPCLWAQRLDPETKKPVGSLIEVQHFHSPGRSVRPGASWAFTKNRLHLPLATQPATSGSPNPRGLSRGASMIGQTISHYKILAKLGEGGMGVVYKAQDTRLDRPVALKFLAPHLLRDEEGRKRFKREAKAAAALDHPNICTVHEIDEADGRTFIAMAFLEGESLNKKIEQGPLKVPEALSIAIQVAEGLEAAHEKGITHRDIKPDNIMLMAGSRGLVKIMDFGLAQLAGSSKFTREGTTLGTMLYMSPEQAGGAETDRRTDIWSLGVVLYEMIAGQPPFRGEFDQALVYSLMNEPPEPLTAVRTGVPKELERIVNKCLAKTPEQRFQHADELLVDLQAVHRELQPQTSRVAPQAVAAKRSSPVVLGSVAALLLVAIGLTWWLTRSGGSALQPPPQYKLTQITRDTGLTFHPALSPNGQLLAYASDRSGDGNLDIWVQQLSAGDPIRLTDHETDDHTPSFSPDSSQIVFFSKREGGGVYTVPALGGNVRRISDGGGPRFSPDGKWISYSLGPNLALVPASGGEPRQVQTGLARSHPGIWSPDGTHLLFWGGEPSGYGVIPDHDWWIVPLEGGEAVSLGAARILEDAGIGLAGPNLLFQIPQPRVWLADGDRILFSGAIGDGAENLWQLRIQPDPWRLLGPPERLTAGTGEGDPSASNDGRIAFTSSSTDWDIWSLPLNTNQGEATGPLERVVTGLGLDAYPTVSADGNKLLYVSARTGNPDVWIRDLTTGVDKPVTVSPQPEFRAAVSPDGSRVVFVRREEGQDNLYLTDLSRGSERKMLEGVGNVMDWLPGGRKVLYYSTPPIRWMTLDAESGATEEITIRHPEYPVHDLRFSPDRRWVSFKLWTGLRHGPMFIARAEGTQIAEQSQWIPIADSLWNSRNWWSPDGRTLYFLSLRDGFFCVWLQHLEPATNQPRGEPVALQHFHGESRTVNSAFFGYGMASDRLYLTLGEAKGNIWLAEPQTAD